MTRAEMPIFTRTFDLLAWLLPATNHFPRPYRHNFTQRLLDAAFDLSESLQEANLRHGEARRVPFRAARGRTNNNEVRPPVCPWPGLTF